MQKKNKIIRVKWIVNPDVSMEDELLDIAVYQDLSKTDLLAYFAARKIKTSTKLDIAANGTVLGKGTVTIKVFPGALRVLASERAEARKKCRKKRQNRNCLSLFHQYPINVCALGRFY